MLLGERDHLRSWWWLNHLQNHTCLPPPRNLFQLFYPRLHARHRVQEKARELSQLGGGAIVLSRANARTSKKTTGVQAGARVA